MGETTVRVGLAGYAAARTLHMPAIREAGGQIVAVATSNPERAEMARSELRADVVADLDELLMRDDLDLIALVTPTALHFEHAMATIEAGIAFVIDKPIATTLQDATAIRDAAKDAGVPMSVFYNRRYDPPHLAMHHAMSSGQLGELHSFDAAWCRWRPTPPKRWRELLSSQEGGGVLLDLATHLIDAALHLGGPAKVVWADIAARRSQADDDVRLVMEHTSGALSTLHASNTNPLAGRRLRAIGSEAAFEFASPSDDVSVNRPGEVMRGDERRVATLPSMGLRSVSWFTPFYAAVRQALETNDPQAMPVQPDEAVAVAEIVEQAREF